jgi:hypothetical protein
MPDLLGDGAGPVIAAGTNNYGVPGHREPAGQTASLFAGASENGDDKPVEGRRLARRHHRCGVETLRIAAGTDQTGFDQACAILSHRERLADLLLFHG